MHVQLALLMVASLLSFTHFTPPVTLVMFNLPCWKFSTTGNTELFITTDVRLKFEAFEKPKTTPKYYGRVEYEVAKLKVELEIDPFELLMLAIKPPY